MLVLARQRDQSVMIARQIEVKVVDIRGDKVRLGFVAPKNVEVDRMEIFQEKHVRDEQSLVVTVQERVAMDSFLRVVIDEAK